ncbi:GNAT family N-acetyltransferase [Limosilactobacillus sp.]|uniref:GNAT family N-acetyltransferase n=1 Tax=Limosilactobacillus sp. TaxID=2773925 RepID=UPI003EFE06A1
MFTITRVTMADLPAVLAIERAGFSPAEAGSPAAFADRIKTLATTFLVARDGKRVVGFVVGPAVAAPFVKDEMYVHTPANLPQGGHQLVLSIAVDPAYRGQGVGSQLLTALEKKARAAHRQTISLTSLAKNVPFYTRNGFTRVGVADSSHAGEIWYNLVKKL